MKRWVKKSFLFFELSQIQNLSFHSQMRIQGILVSYNILIEFYVMINNFFILYLHVLNPSNNVFHMYLGWD